MAITTIAVGDRLRAWNGTTYEVAEAECVCTGPQGQTAWIVDLRVPADEERDEPETCIVLAGGEAFCDVEFYCGDEKYLAPDRFMPDQFLMLMRYVDMQTGIPPANVIGHWPVQIVED